MVVGSDGFPSHGLNEEQRTFLIQEFLEVLCSPQWIAHVMEAVKDAEEVELAACCSDGCSVLGRKGDIAQRILRDSELNTSLVIVNADDS